MLAHAFNIFAFDNGADALRFARDSDREVYAAIVDYAMPQMNGKSVCSELLGIDPTICLIGGTGNKDADFACPLFAFVPKTPINFTDIVAITGRSVDETHKRRTNETKDG